MYARMNVIIVIQAEARLAVSKLARIEARSIRTRELERQQIEVWSFSLDFVLFKFNITPCKIKVIKLIKLNLITNNCIPNFIQSNCNTLTAQNV